MNEFLEQFLVESRELVDAATDDLLAIEKSPDDAERFDNALRAIHTLKGGAGIVEFAAMQRVTHFAEDVLASARASSTSVSARDVSDCLACLDRVVQWLEVIQRTGELPADADAAAFIAGFDRSKAGPRPAEPAPSAEEGAWLEGLLRGHSTAAAHATTAIRYVPLADSFFQHQDPVALIAALPGLLAVDIGPRAPWLELAEVDPFACNLVLTALVDASYPDALAALGDEARCCDVVPLASRTVAKPSNPVLQRAQELLEAQLLLLAAVDASHEPGRIATAGVAAANVLRAIGRTNEADGIAAAAMSAAAQRARQQLRQTVGATLASKPRTETPAAATQTPGGLVPTLRVRTDRVDELVKLTGELTVAKNAIGHAVKLAASEGSRLASALKDRQAALERLVGELQRSVLAMRVLPLRRAFQRFPRLVREMSVDLGKPANLVIEGEDTEADKAIVEVLVEPLVHVLRNAMDHGIEEPPARAAAGKPPVATIRLRALREADHVLLEVSDDGRGIDLAQVRQVAKKRNVVPAHALASMSDAEVIDLIFAPGFSTAPAVTEVSGRGVGMDVVRTAVSRLGGRVHASSVPGQGVTVHFTLPFSVMMTQVMTVEAGGQMFGIPLDAVVETIRVPRESIFPVGAAHAIVLRDRTIPLVRLGGVLGKPPPEEPGEAASVIVANIDGDVGAMQVDRVGERMDIILKPLDGLLAGVPGIAGSTLLGDGTVLLVLDLKELLL